MTSFRRCEWTSAFCAVVACSCLWVGCGSFDKKDEPQPSQDPVQQAGNPNPNPDPNADPNTNPPSPPLDPASGEPGTANGDIPADATSPGQNNPPATHTGTQPDVTPGSDSGGDTSGPILTPPADGTQTPDPRCPNGGRWLTGIFGHVSWADNGSGSFSDASIQACLRRMPGNSLVCAKPRRPDSNGLFTIEFSAGECVTAVTVRAFASRPGFASTYRQLSLRGATERIEVAPPLVLVGTGEFATIPYCEEEPNACNTSADVQVDALLSMQLLAANLQSDAESLGVARLSAEAASAHGINLPAGAAWVYAFSPESAIAQGGFSALLRTAYPVGTQIQLWVQGGLSCKLTDGTPVPEGGWAAIGPVAVSSDGFVRFTLPCLNWLAFGPLTKGSR